MKKLFQILLVFFVFGILVQGIHILFSKGYTIQYDVQTNMDEVKVEESYITNQKNSLSQYQFLIDDTFSFDIYDNLGKDSKLVRKILLYNDDDYICIYPIFKTKKIKMDILCKKDNIQIYYHNIKGKNKSLDTFASKIETYNESLFIDQKEELENQKFLTVYTNDIPKDHYIVTQNYKGITIFNNQKLKETTLYTKDVYSPTMSALAGKYFITADYKDSYYFRTFYIVDITKSEKKEIKSPYDISYDAYVEGVYKNAIYIFDPSKNRQYKIDGKKREISLIGDAKKGFMYYNGESFVQKNMQEIKKEKLIFQNYPKASIKETSYISIDKVGTKLTGYYYFYSKVEDKIQVYRSSISNPNQKTYLFETTDMSDIMYNHGHIYFNCDGTIYYYSDQTGLRTILNHSEMSFNKNLRYFSYTK